MMRSERLPDGQIKMSGPVWHEVFGEERHRWAVSGSRIAAGPDRDVLLWRSCCGGRGEGAEVGAFLARTFGAPACPCKKQ